MIIRIVQIEDKLHLLFSGQGHGVLYGEIVFADKIFCAAGVMDGTSEAYAHSPAVDTQIRGDTEIILIERRVGVLTKGGDAGYQKRVVVPDHIVYGDGDPVFCDGFPHDCLIRADIPVDTKKDRQRVKDIQGSALAAEIYKLFRDCSKQLEYMKSQ